MSSTRTNGRTRSFVAHRTMDRVALAAMLLILPLFAAFASAAGPAPPATPNAPNPPAATPDAEGSLPLIREVFVPLKDFDALMDGQTDRVLLPRDEYERLREEARVADPTTPAPVPYAIVSGDQDVTVVGRRARIVARYELDLMNDDLTAVSLTTAGTGLQAAMLDDVPAAIGGDPNRGEFTLFAKGRGRHELTLHLVTPLTTTAAQQELHFRLPTATAGTTRLTVPGDVELKSGASVVRRDVDEEPDGGSARATRLTLLPPTADGVYDLVMTLNSHTKRSQRAVLAGSVVVDEVTETYERLHATVTCDVLHRAVDTFRFAVPKGFDVTGVSTPDLARWTIETDAQADGQAVLNVKLRQETTGAVTLGIQATNMSPVLEGWTMPQLTPLDVIGSTAVVGLLVDDRLRATSIASSGLVPINTDVLREALPESVFQADPGAPPIRPVAAWYAPKASDYTASADFVKPEATIDVTTNILLQLEDSRQVALGGFALEPEYEKVFEFDFALPEAWRITSITDSGGAPLAFERPEPTRVHVRLNEGIAPGTLYEVMFEAVAMPKGWLGVWDEQEVEFPTFQLLGATSDVGAIAIQAGQDMTLRPDPNQTEQLAPLDEAMRQQCLKGIHTDLAYRYAEPGYKLVFTAERLKPRLTAKSYTFARIRTDALDMHCQIDYTVDESRARELRFTLPEDAPESIDVVGLDGLAVKEDTMEAVIDGRQHWVVRLGEPRRGVLRLMINFEQPLKVEEAETAQLPIILADEVAWQSGLVAVEGNEELDVEIKPGAETRKVDVGELRSAVYTPGQRLLGAYSFVGQRGEVSVEVTRHPAYPLYTTIVQDAVLNTRLSANGVAETLATYRFRTKAMYIELTLPKGETDEVIDHGKFQTNAQPEAELWSASIDGKPIKPQADKNRLLISLPSGNDQDLHELKVFYRQDVPRLGLSGKVGTQAPRLWTRPAPDEKPTLIPVADLQWRVIPPAGYRVTGSKGTVMRDTTQPKPIVNLKYLGAIFIPSSTLGCGVQMARESARSQMATDGAFLADDVGYEATTSESAAIEDAEWGEGEALGDVIDAAEEESAPAALEEPLVERETRSREIALDEMMSLATSETQPADGPATGEEGGELRNDYAGLVIAPDAEPQMPAPKPVHRKRLDGFRSLMIDMNEDPAVAANAIVLTSLGEQPELELSMTNNRVFSSLAYCVGALVALGGFVFLRRTPSFKAKYVIYIAAAALLIPLIPGLEPTQDIANCAFKTALLLIPFFLACGLLACVWRFMQSVCPICRAMASCCEPERKKTDVPGKGPLVGLLIAATLSLSAISSPVAQAQDANTLTADGVTVMVAPPPGPVQIPDDAVLVPYDPTQIDGAEQADHLLIPLAKYVELWNRAHPDEPLTTKEPPTSYAPGGVSYAATLLDEDYLTVHGKLLLDVYIDDPVSVPLNMGGGVLTGAALDGKPARLSVTSAPVPQMEQQVQQQRAAPVQTPQLAVLHVEGKGRHTLDFTIRIRLDHQGGWRVALGTLPTAPAADVTLTVPDAETDVRLGQVADQRRYETEQPGQEIETTLGPNGTLHVQWRPKVAEGQVDRSLTANSRAIFDVQENGLRLVWQVRLDFRHGHHESFEIRVPADYLVESIEGGNVRGWEVTNPDDAPATPRNVEIELLKAAEQQETFTVRLLKKGAVGSENFSQFDVPSVSVVGTSLHTGELMLRRSPLLDVRATGVSGVTRTDLSSELQQQLGAQATGEENPFEVRELQAFRFVAEPFLVRINAVPIKGTMRADVQNVLQISEFERTLDTRAQLVIAKRPVYQVELLLPEELRLQTVNAPGDFDWAETQRDGRRLLTIYSTTGFENTVSVMIKGTLPADQPLAPMDLPKLEVLNVTSQINQFAVQADPAYNVTATGLRNCDHRLLDQMRWIQAKNRDQTRIALSSPAMDFDGRLEFSLRKPDIHCETITNVQVTDRAVQETIALNYTINKAGVRELAFLLPPWMADARIDAPVIQQKIVEPADDGSDALRVTLKLQEEQMNEYRVLISNDRLLVPMQPYEAPLPTILAGETRRRFIVLENAGGLDEIIVDEDQLGGLELLTRQRPEWAKLASILGDRITKAYLVDDGAKSPRLVFHTLQRSAYQMAGARIGLSETVLVIDAQGAFRAEQAYRIDNKSEQFLDVELPENAVLWTAQLFTADNWSRKQAGEPALGVPLKPTIVPGATSTRMVRIPLIKTEVGDLDYVIRLQYGGKTTPPTSFRKFKFPLMRVLDIPVEQAAVRLQLPPGFQYYRFRGTLDEVEDDSVNQAIKAYQAKQDERLSRAERSGNQYERERANRSRSRINSVSNFFGSIVSKASDGDYGDYGYGEESIQVIVDGSEPMPAAGQPVAQAVQMGEQGQADAAYADNRVQLRNFVDEQRNERAKNIVQDAGSNWDIKEIEQQTQRGVQNPQFNTKWFDQNKLANPTEAPPEEKASEGQESTTFESMDSLGKKPQSRVQMEVQRQAVEFDTAQTKGGKVAQNALFDKMLANQSAGTMAQPQGGQVRGEQMQQMQQVISGRVATQPAMPGGGAATGAYDNRDGGEAYGNDAGGYAYGRTGQAADISGDGAYYAPPQTAASPRYSAPTNQPATTAGLAAPGVFTSDLNIPMEQNSFGLAVPQFGGYDVTATPALSPTATGMMSLDVDMPTLDGGIEMLFTAPQGELELTVVPVAEPVIDRTWQIVVIIVLAVIALLIVTIARLGCFAWVKTKTFAVTACLAGVVLLCCMPGLGVLLLGASGAVAMTLMAKKNEE